MTNAVKNIRTDLLYPDESTKIVEAASEVYKHFGGSFKESIVDNALTIALEKKRLKVECQKRIDVYFEGVKVGVYIPDKIIEEKIIIELKSKPFLGKEDEKQFWRYLKATPYKLGFLINFGPKQLEIKRRVYDLARPASNVALQ